MKISELLESIRKSDIVLPEFQRVCLDSIPHLTHSWDR